MRFANELSRYTDDGFFLRFPELYDCVPNDATQKKVALSIASLLKRHSETVLRVMEDQLTRFKRQLVRGQLPNMCLTRLVAAPPGAEETGWFRPGPGYREIGLGEDTITLTTNQARVVEHMDSFGDAAVDQNRMLEELGIKSRKLSQVFRKTDVIGRLIVPAEGKGLFRLKRSPL